MFCRASLIDHLKTLLARPAFYEKFDHWKQIPLTNGLYKDVYDGNIWRDFQCYKGQPFLSQAFCYGLMLNIDWFRPCKHTEYSIGAMYLTVMNLPRSIRFRQENVLLIPGPKEPKHDINCYLRPLVKELLKLWSGVEISVPSLGRAVQVRCALLCVACDVPAERKVCGFLGHSARLGCSKCLKEFPGPVGCKDYSGFNRSLWPQRTLQEHRRNVTTINKCTTVKDQTDNESRYGCRYSTLLDLPYFDPIRMTIIDPMHNLYLGTSKHILKNVWMSKDLITPSDLSVIQDRIDSMQVPRYVGRIPYKIASSFSGFTADQFKSWTNYFSLICLRDILPDDHLKCWQLFVMAARLLCQMSITQTEIELADALLLRFCEQMEELYGKTVITPNMHLHCHLKTCLMEYGPVHNFWLFVYERYNGIFENYPSSNHSLEIQLTKRFLGEFHLYSTLPQMHAPAEFEDDFDTLLKGEFEPHLAGSLQATVHSMYNDRPDPRSLDNWQLKPCDLELNLPSSYLRSCFSECTLAEVKAMYGTLYPMTIASMYLTSSFRKYHSVQYRASKYTSGQVIYVRLLGSLDPRPAIINYFALHAIQDEDVHQHLLVSLSWLKTHPAKNSMKKPVELWWKDLFQEELNDIVPIQLVICHAVSCKYSMKSKQSS